jgi:hypothetical protein
VCICRKRGALLMVMMSSHSKINRTRCHFRKSVERRARSSGRSGCAAFRLLAPCPLGRTRGAAGKLAIRHRLGPRSRRPAPDDVKEGVTARVEQHVELCSLTPIRCRASPAGYRCAAHPGAGHDVDRRPIGECSRCLTSREACLRNQAENAAGGVPLRSIRLSWPLAGCLAR